MPKSEDRGDLHCCKLTVRLTADQYEGIVEDANLAELPVAVYARLLLLGKDVTVVNRIVVDVPGVEPAVAALGRVGNNVNQIARWLNSHTSMDDALRAEASSALGEVAGCARLLTRLATDGVDAGVGAWQSSSTYR